MHTKRGAARNLYETLDVSKKASEDEIRRSIKKVIIKIHPDKNPQKYRKFLDSLRTLVIKTEEILTDPVNRKCYDHLLSQNSIEPHGDIYTDFDKLNHAIKTIRIFGPNLFH